ncbi:MAG: hypothetical protein R2854_25935 [Caldilineaceae bacterium]
MSIIPEQRAVALLLRERVRRRRTTRWCSTGRAQRWPCPPCCACATT